MKGLWLVVLISMKILFVSAQLDVHYDKKCCPCPDILDSAKNVQMSDLRDNLDCPCLQTNVFDSEPSPSMLTRNSVMRAPTSKDDSKPLLHPEVGLASSVLQTLHEATDEEYRDALERDLARNALKENEDNNKQDTQPSTTNLVTIVVKSPGVYDMEVDTKGEESHQHEARCALPISQTLGAKRKESYTYLPTLVKPYPLTYLRRPIYDVYDQGFEASNIKDNIKVMPDVNARIPKLKSHSNAFTDSIIKKVSTRPYNLRNKLYLNEKDADYDSDVSPSNINNVVHVNFKPNSDETAIDCLNISSEGDSLKQMPLKSNLDFNFTPPRKYNLEERLEALEKLHKSNLDYLNNKIKENNIKLKESFPDPPSRLIPLKLKNNNVEVQIEPMVINTTTLPKINHNIDNLYENSMNTEIKTNVSEEIDDKDNSKDLKFEDLEVMSNTLLEKSIEKENQLSGNKQQYNPTIQSEYYNQVLQNDNINAEADEKNECITDSNSPTNKVISDTSEQASEDAFSIVPQTKTPETLHGKFVELLPQNKIVQPEFLLPKASDFNIDELFKDLPSIESIKNKVAEIFDMEEMKKKTNVQSLQPEFKITKPLTRIPLLKETKNIFPENGLNFDIFRMQPLKSPYLFPNDLSTGLNFNSFKENLPNLQALPIKPLKLGSVKKGKENILRANLFSPETNLEKVRSNYISGLPKGYKIQVNQNKPHNNILLKRPNVPKLPVTQSSQSSFVVPTLKPLEIQNQNIASSPPSTYIGNVGNESQLKNPYNKALLINVLSNTKLVDPTKSKSSLWKEDPKMSQNTDFLNDLNNFKKAVTANNKKENLSIKSRQKENPTKITLNPPESQLFTLPKYKNNKMMLPSNKEENRNTIGLNPLLKNDGMVLKSINFHKSIPTSMKLGNLNEVPLKLENLNSKLTNIFSNSKSNLDEHLLSETFKNIPLINLDKFKPKQSFNDFVTSISKQFSEKNTGLSTPAKKKMSYGRRVLADTQKLANQNDILKENLNVKPLLSKFRESLNDFAKLSFANDNGLNSKIQSISDTGLFDMKSANTCESPIIVKEKNDEVNQTKINNTRNTFIQDLSSEPSENIKEVKQFIDPNLLQDNKPFVKNATNENCVTNEFDMDNSSDNIDKSLKLPPEIGMEKTDTKQQIPTNVSPKPQEILSLNKLNDGIKLFLSNSKNNLKSALNNYNNKLGINGVKDKELNVTKSPLEPLENDIENFKNDKAIESASNIKELVRNNVNDDTIINSYEEEAFLPDDALPAIFKNIEPAAENDVDNECTTPDIDHLNYFVDTISPSMDLFNKLNENSFVNDRDINNIPKDTITYSKDGEMDSLVEPTENHLIKEKPNNIKNEDIPNYFHLRDLLPCKDVTTSLQSPQENNNDKNEIKQNMMNNEKVPLNNIKQSKKDTNENEFRSSERKVTTEDSDKKVYGKPLNFEALKNLIASKDINNALAPKNVINKPINIFAITEKPNIFPKPLSLDALKELISIKHKKKESLQLTKDLEGTASNSSVEIDCLVDNVNEATEIIKVTDNPSKNVTDVSSNFNVEDQTITPTTIESTKDGCKDMETVASENMPTSLCAMGKPIEGNVSYKCKLICTKDQS